MQGVLGVIIDWQLGHFSGADPAYAEGIAKALSLPRGKSDKTPTAD